MHLDWSKQLTQNKAIEIEFITYKKDEDWSWFIYSFRWNRNTDHAGLRFEYEILGYAMIVNIYDIRHWNYKKKCWYVCDKDTGEKE